MNTLMIKNVKIRLVNGTHVVTVPKAYIKNGYLKAGDRVNIEIHLEAD